MSCECDLCKRNHRFRDVVAKLQQEDKDFLNNLYDYLLDVELDLDWYRCITDGVQPHIAPNP